MRALSENSRVALIIALLSLLASGFVSYSHNDKAISERVSKLEAHRDDDKEQLNRLESKVDSLLRWAGVK